MQYPLDQIHNVNVKDRSVLLVVDAPAPSNAVSIMVVALGAAVCYWYLLGRCRVPVRPGSKKPFSSWARTWRPTSEPKGHQASQRRSKHQAPRLLAVGIRERL